MGEFLGFLGAIVALGLWWFVIRPLVGRAVSATASGAVNALRPGPDPTTTMLKATAKARPIFEDHVSTFLSYSDADWDKLDAGVRNGVEAQMMVVVFSVTLLNIATQDVAYDEDRVDFLAVATGGGNPFPKVKVKDEVWRVALRDLWSRFSVPTRMNLDMRYRYIFQEGLMSSAEGGLFEHLTNYATRTLTDQFSYGTSANTDWLGFVDALANGRMDEARLFIAEAV